MNEEIRSLVPESRGVHAFPLKLLEQESFPQTAQLRGLPVSSIEYSEDQTIIQTITNKYSGSSALAGAHPFLCV